MARGWRAPGRLCCPWQGSGWLPGRVGMGRPWTRGWNTEAFPLRLAPTCLFPTAQNQSLPKDDKGEDKKTKKSKEIKPTKIAKSVWCEH